MNTRGAQPDRAKRGAPAERSEALRASEASRNPELREGLQTKQGCDPTAAIQLPRLNCLGRRESVLSTYGIHGESSQSKLIL